MTEAEAIVLDRDSGDWVGFPPPLLGPSPLRVPVVRPGEGLLALALPGGVLSDAHPLHPGVPGLVGAMRQQVQADKPELTRLGCSVALGVNFLEPETGGILLVAVTREATDRWRNAHGSSQLRFVYRFVTQAYASQEAEMVCELPLARHREKPLMLVSHRSGKGAKTVFRRLAEAGDLALWEAESAFFRPHQLRLHAAECGLRIPGECLYGQVEGLSGRHGERLSGWLPVWLTRAEAPGTDGFTPVHAPAPKALSALWREFGDF